MAFADKPYLGHAVENHQIRFTSVSQIVVAHHDFEGGCRRRWAFRYIFGKKEVKTAAQLAGNKFASSLEMYLKTGYDAMEPELRVAKHLFPKYDPARPLIVEEPLGDIGAAVKVRERVLADPSLAVALLPEIRRLAGLVANGIPLTGAADFAHLRQEYVDGDGVLKREDPRMVVAEVVDLKSHSRVLSSVSRNGVTYEGYAKTIEQILEHPQTLAYGVWIADKFPDVTHVRLGHVAIQSKGAKVAIKRTGLLSTEEMRCRWQKYDTFAAEMEQIARAAKPEDVPFNINSCFAFHRECDHAPYCDRSGARRSILDIMGITIPKENTVDLFNQLAINPQAPAIPQAAPPIPAVAPPVPATMTAEQREAAIAAETARLLAEDAAPQAPRVGCGAPGCGEGCAPGWQKAAMGFAECPACKGTGRRPIGAILPPDAPTPSALASAAALSPEAIAEITNPELLIRAEANARAHALKAETEKVAKDAASPSTAWCAASGWPLILDPNIAVKSYLCPVCRKKCSIKFADGGGASLPKHRPLAGALPAQPVESLAAAGGAVPPPIPTLGAFLTEGLPPPIPVQQRSSVAGKIPVVACVTGKRYLSNGCSGTFSGIATSPIGTKLFVFEIISPPTEEAHVFRLPIDGFVDGESPAAVPPPIPGALPTCHVASGIDATSIGICVEDVRQALKFLSAAQDVADLDSAMARPLVDRALALLTKVSEELT